MFDRSPHQIGAYTLIPHERWMLWTAMRQDGEEIPFRLRGQFTDPEDFRKAAEKVHGSEYSWDVIQAERKAFLDEEARQAAIFGVRSAARIHLVKEG